MYNPPEFRERSKRLDPRHPGNEEEALCSAAQPTKGGRSCPRPQWGSPCHPPAPAFHVPSQTPGAKSSQCGKQLPCEDFLNSFQEESGALQLFTAETIKSVLRTERNQQMMSDVNFMSAVLATCRHPHLHLCRRINNDVLQAVLRGRGQPSPLSFPISP